MKCSQKLKIGNSFVLLLVLVTNSYVFGFDYKLKNYGINEGLPSAQVYEIIQDQKGYIWFGTDRGLVKYNGLEFTIYTTNDGLSSNVIYHLYENEESEIWCYGKDHKLHYYHNGKFFPFAYNDSLIKYFPKDGDLLYFTANKNEAIISILNYSSARHYFKINCNGLVLENTNQGIFIKDNEEIVTISVNELSNIYYNDSLIYILEKEMLTDQFISASKKFCNITKFESDLYLSVANKVIKFSPNGIGKVSVTDLGEKLIQDITCDKAGNVFVSHDKGIIWFEKGNLKKPHQLLNNHNISNILVDDNQRIWIASLFSGLFQLNNIQHQHFFVESEKKIFGLFEIDDKIYFELNTRELYQITDRVLKNLSLALQISQKHIFSSRQITIFLLIN